MSKKTPHDDTTPLLQLHNQEPQRLNKVQYFFSCHLRAFLFALGELIRYPLGNFVTICVIGIAFSLPVILFELLQNAKTATASFHGTPTILLYLKQDTTTEQVTALLSTLQKNLSIASAHYITPEAGLQSLQSDDSVSAAVDAIGTNPLPGVIEVTPSHLDTDPDTIGLLYNQLKANPLVDIAQLNMTWVKRLFYLIETLKQLTTVIAFVFFIGLILIVGNTIRLDMKSHQEEIDILRLIGANNAFIRRPLLYKGLLYGFIGSIVALIIGNIVLWRLAAPITELTSSYNTVFALQSLSANQILLFLCACALLGYLGAGFVANYFLRR